MRIVIDLQGAQSESRYRGIGRYSLSLAQGIARRKGEHEVIIALNALFPETIKPLREAFQDLLPAHCIRTWYAPAPVREILPGNEARREAAEEIREAFLASLQPDVLLVASLFEGYADDAVTSIGRIQPPFPVMTVLYDLIPFLNPDKYLASNPRFEKYYRRKIASLRDADGYLAISNASAIEGKRTLALPEEAVTVISTACDTVFRPISVSSEEKEDLFARMGIIKDFVLYTGGVDDRKNLPRLIRAFALLPESIRQNCQLVLAGRIPEGNLYELRRAAADEGLTNDRFICPGYVPDDDLVRLYALCSLFVLPSLHEGFGLPALEAMSCGAPVIGSSSSSIPEVIGLEEALFDPLDEHSIAAKIEFGLTDSEFRRRLVRNAVAQSKRFSWDSTARRAINFFEAWNTRNKIGSSLRIPAITAETTAGQIVRSCGDRLTEHDLLQTAWALCINHPEPGPSRLFVDISELCQRDARSGVQRVTRSILKQFLDNPPGNVLLQPAYATTEETGYRCAKNFIRAFQGSAPQEEKDSPIEFHAGDVFLGLDLQHHVVQRQKLYLEELHRAGVRVYFVVYDLLPVLLPHCFLPGTEEAHSEWLRTICRFDGAFCISRSVAEELRSWREKNIPADSAPFRIGWFHLGADVENSIPSKGVPEDGEKILTELRKHPSFVMVGTVEPRKGHTQALAAMEELWASGEDLNLVVVGKQGWMTEDLCLRLREHPQAGTRLFWIEDSSDEFLEKIYQASTCLLAASEGEGFGLPLVEAAKHGIPAIARDLPVFREVAGEHAFYFSGADGNDLARAIQTWIGHYKQSLHPQSAGLRRLTWEESAAQLLGQVLFECPR